MRLQLPGTGLVGKWDVYQVTMSGALPRSNPFKDAQLRATFRSPTGRSVAACV